MFKTLFSKITGVSSVSKKDTSSEFSKFFREASSREKKKVFMDVAKKASKEQLDIINDVEIVR